MLGKLEVAIVKTATATVTTTTTQNNDNKNEKNGDFITLKIYG